MPKNEDMRPGIRMQNLQQPMRPDEIHVHRGFDTTYEPAGDRGSESELIPQKKTGWGSTPEGNWGYSTVDVEGAYAQRGWTT